MWNSAENLSVRSASFREDGDDEEALRWAALERLPTYARVRRGIFRNILGDVKEIDVDKLENEERKVLLGRLFDSVDDDWERFFNRMRRRFERVDLEFPKVEVRFQNLNIETFVHVGSRALPTIPNFISNMAEGLLRTLKIYSAKRRKLVILDSVSGIIRPSRLTLLLGPPSSGKTTLLMALAGRLKSDLQVTGKVTYNGHGLNEFVPQRTSAYVNQQDWHAAEMTVRETLDLSARCQGVGFKHDMLLELSRREKIGGIIPDEDLDIFIKALALEGKETGLVVEYILKILGLEICADTLVGDEMLKGISGGQKKRLTTGELLVGPTRVMFMDEISTGLDSSSTYQIIRYLRHSTRALDGTAIISLLQPAPETFELFDDIILLSEGQIVYQGPREDVLDFFSSMGFHCPERKNVADFLQEVVSKKDQQQYWNVADRPFRYTPVAKFAEAFRSYRIGKSLSEDLGIPFDRRYNHPAALSTSKYGVSRRELLRTSFDWQLLLMKRNSFIYVFKFIQLLLVALITMSVFFRTTLHRNTIDDGGLFLGALYFSMVIILFNGFTEVSMLVAKLPVIYKHRDLHFYPCWAYTLPSWILSIPTSLIESGFWVAVTYYVVGYDPNIIRFFRQFLLFFFLHQMSLALFRLMGALGRNMIVANTFGSFAMLIVMVLGGYIISRDRIPSWWIWGFWISPLMYAQDAASVNEFLGHSWDKISSNNSNLNLGEAVLRARSLFPQSYWYWIGLGALLGYTILFNSLFTFFLAYLDPLVKHQAIISEEDVQDSNIARKDEPVIIQLREYLKFSGSLARKSFKQKGMVLPFQPLSMSFSNINYYVDVPLELKQQGILEDRLQLLVNVTGAFRPGVLTALVGVSGAGKTTLMDVLAGRKTGGVIEGNIHISGHPKKQETFARISGYCEQNDIHSPCLTVLESLLFSAWLRLASDVDLETQKAFVEEVMELVELTPLRGALVGLPGVDGLSTEQRKRLTIAVELVANPSIVFMDEPTSGLDARAAAIVMRTVRNIVNTGRTIVCTIHQPSIDIFESFDELLLMKRGGELIYAGVLGPKSCNLIEYFEAIDGVPKIRPGYNPATWMLEVTSSIEEARLGVDFADIYRKSNLFQYNKVLVERLSRPSQDSKDLSFPTKYSKSYFNQFVACLWKQNLSYWRNPQYTAVRFFYTLIISLMLGTICWRFGSERETQQDIFNAMGSMYAAVLFIGITNATAVQPVVSVERFVSYRERAAGMYSALPFAFAQVVIEFPYVFGQTLIYSAIFYSLAAFEWSASKFLWYIFFMYFTVLYFTFYGMMTTAVTPNHNVAAIIAAPFYMLWNLFSGFMIPHKRIPIWWRWYYWANPVAWSLYGLVASQYSDSERAIKLSDGVESTPLNLLVKVVFGYRHDFIGIAGFMVVGFCILFAVIFAYAIKSFNFQKR
ncbi:PREDICTED: ABC transporter G family member 32 isoform X2 [Ipomoea nil]|uniref:ABC transporter G family member 32 isoform X2 n=2 Tax=Ipomoea nil TaxID=35883 RepID=UPI0009008512|nr:PREDICTED: ABC transporter G family member 32 isoform X2 [Ipomoea nil]